MKYIASQIVRNKVPFSTALFVLLFGVAIIIAPSVIYADSPVGYKVLTKPGLKIKACINQDGKPRPIYGCARQKGVADQTTLPETAQIIIDRQPFHLCHARTRGVAGYSPTVGWGTYIDTPEELKVGKCPSPETLRKWFMRDVKISYDRGMAQARMLGNDNACMVRTLASINHQLGDLRRKYPNKWAMLSRGESCALAVDMLTWSWYEQTCDRALDNILAFDTIAGGCKIQY